MLQDLEIKPFQGKVGLGLGLRPTAQGPWQSFRLKLKASPLLSQESKEALMCRNAIWEIGGRAVNYGSKWPKAILAFFITHHIEDLPCLSKNKNTNTMGH